MTHGGWTSWPRRAVGSGWSARARGRVAAQRSWPTSRAWRRGCAGTRCPSPPAPATGSFAFAWTRTPSPSPSTAAEIRGRWPGSRPWCAARWRATSRRCGAASRPGSSAPRACSPTRARAAAPASRRSSRARATTSRAPSPTPTPTLPGAPPMRAPSRRSTRARWRPSPPPPGCTEGSSRPTGV